MNWCVIATILLRFHLAVGDSSDPPFNLDSILGTSNTEETTKKEDPIIFPQHSDPTNNVDDLLLDVDDETVDTPPSKNSTDDNDDVKDASGVTTPMKASDNDDDDDTGSTPTTPTLSDNEDDDDVKDGSGATMSDSSTHEDDEDFESSSPDDYPLIVDAPISSENISDDIKDILDLLSIDEESQKPEATEAKEATEATEATEAKESTEATATNESDTSNWARVDSTTRTVVYAGSGALVAIILVLVGVIMWRKGKPSTRAVYNVSLEQANTRAPRLAEI